MEQSKEAKTKGNQTQAAEILATKAQKALGHAGEYFPRAYRRLESCAGRQVPVFFVAKILRRSRVFCRTVRQKLMVCFCVFCAFCGYDII